MADILSINHEEDRVDSSHGIKMFSQFFVTFFSHFFLLPPLIFLRTSGGYLIYLIELILPINRSKYFNFLIFNFIIAEICFV